MSTGIEWTDETWNPVTGCTKVSPGCDHCYAERITNRFGGPGAFDTVVLHHDRIDAPLHWRKPRRVFVNSMSDLWHDDVPDDFIHAVFVMMAAAPQHTFQVLTKRPGRMASFVRRLYWDINGDLHLANSIYEELGRDEEWSYRARPLPNVWLGTSVENQHWADVRITKLLETPAAVRFLSCEPLLGPVDIHRWLPDLDDEGEQRCQAHGLRECRQGCTGIDWVIAGGESGPGARPMHPSWVRSLRDQCEAVEVPYFLKQWGEWQSIFTINDDWPSSDVWVNKADGRVATEAEALKGGDWHQVARVGKKAAGRELDGRTWDEFPKDSHRKGRADDDAGGRDGGEDSRVTSSTARESNKSRTAPTAKGSDLPDLRQSPSEERGSPDAGVGASHYGRHGDGDLL